MTSQEFGVRSTTNTQVSPSESHYRFSKPILGSVFPSARMDAYSSLVETGISQAHQAISAGKRGRLICGVDWAVDLAVVSLSRLNLYPGPIEYNYPNSTLVTLRVPCFPSSCSKRSTPS